MRKAKKVKIPNLDADLAYLCGILVGDGYIKIRKHKKEYVINCGGNPQNEIEFYENVVAPLFKKLFNVEVKPKLLGKTYGVIIYSKNLVNFLLSDIGLKESPKNDLTIPKIFYNHKDLLFNFIRGVADTDFSFKLRDGRYPLIAGSSKSKELMENISDILEQEGFKVLKYFNYKINDNRLKKGYNIIHRIDINGHKQFAKWINTIGTKQPKNLEKIKTWKNSSSQV